MSAFVSCHLSLDGRGRIARRFSAVGDPGEGGAARKSDYSIQPFTLTLSHKGRGDVLVARAWQNNDSRAAARRLDPWVKPEDDGVRGGAVRMFRAFAAPRESRNSESGRHDMGAQAMSALRRFPSPYGGGLGWGMATRSLRRKHNPSPDPSQREGGLSKAAR
jgi:hypothetical protein